MLKITLLVLAGLGLSPAVAFACDTSPTAFTGELRQAGTYNSTATDNFGYYVWNDSSASWMLVQAGYQPSAESAQMETSDIPLSSSQLGGGDGGGGGGDETMPQFNCDPDPPTDLPPVVVTGSRPTGFSVMLVYRPSYFSGGSGGGFGRLRAGRPLQADKNLTCASGHEERKAAALGAIRPLGLVANRSTYLVTYAPGHHQTWMVTVPQFTDRGLQPVGECFKS